VRTSARQGNDTSPQRICAATGFSKTLSRMRCSKLLRCGNGSGLYDALGKAASGARPPHRKHQQRDQKQTAWTALVTTRNHAEIKIDRSQVSISRNFEDCQRLANMSTAYLIIFSALATSDQTRTVTTTNQYPHHSPRGKQQAVANIVGDAHPHKQGAADRHDYRQDVPEQIVFATRKCASWLAA
jgi:hypothetical protein